MDKILTMTILLFLFPTPHWGQQLFRVMSYNVENLFDTEKAPDKNDNDFLPTGNRHWTPGRYYHKLQQIAQVISAAGEWDTPALVGLCEVENDSVLLHLLHRTPLKRQQYRYCRTHGQDTRGINVALLYQRDKFAYTGHTEYQVRFSRKQHKQTRNILHVWGNVITGHILDIFVCHFPSRYGGEKESETDRFDAARTLRSLCDSLQQIRPYPQIIIMGDFNDTPEDKSMTDILTATFHNQQTPDNALSDRSLYNLFADRTQRHHPGSHKYQGEWSQLDQILISANLTDTTASMHLKPDSPHIFAPDFLLTNDKTWRGKRPYRTFYGYKYEGGYSDHLPIIADFLLSVPTDR
jgi:endonuclease/exonuclease/phosphatase family metal-dependent hydrolase